MTVAPRRPPPTGPGSERPPGKEGPMSKAPSADARRLRVRIVLHDKTIARLPWTEDARDKDRD